MNAMNREAKMKKIALREEAAVAGVIVAVIIIIAVALIMLSGCGRENGGTCNPALAADGDVNVDCTVTAADVELAMAAVTGAATLTPEQMVHADVAPVVNGVSAPDGVVDIGDVVVIASMVQN